MQAELELTATSFMSLSATVLMGIVGALIMFVGAHQMTATPPTMTLGGFMSYTMFLAFLIAPMFQIVAIGMGDADRDYLRRLSNTDEGAIFARQGELVQAFGHIARVISQGGRALRIMS